MGNYFECSDQQYRNIKFSSCVGTGKAGRLKFGEYPAYVFRTRVADVVTWAQFKYNSTLPSKALRCEIP